MLVASNYLDQTRSAVSKIYEGIASYRQHLREAVGATFMTSESDETRRREEFMQWQRDNVVQVVAAHAAMHRFSSEYFALNILCGAVLQVADKGLEMFAQAPSALPDMPFNVGLSNKKYCVGRQVNGLPMGAIIHAARNQYAHFNEPSLHRFADDVFRVLSGAEMGAPADPAFDVKSPGNEVRSASILSLLSWDAQDSYERDMRHMLNLDA